MNEEIVKLKREAYEACRLYVAGALQRIKEAMKEAQEAANEETKSSAGDKYETTHAMMMLEKEKFSGQHAEMVKLQRVLDQIEPDKKNTRGRLGALIHTSNGWYYLAIGTGKLNVTQESVFAVSLASPIGKLLEGKGVGDVVLLNGKELKVLEVY